MSEFWNLEPEDISNVYEGVFSSCYRSSLFSRDSLFYEGLTSVRSLQGNELSPELSVGILEEYGIDPYSSERGVDGHIMRSEEGHVIRVGNDEEVVYMGIDEGDLPEQPDYLSESHRWRS